MKRTASCPCGALTASCVGEPVRVSVCHCLQCKRRSGSAFSAQARWPTEQVTIAGPFSTWSRRGESGGLCRFHFCPTCGSTIAYEIDMLPGLTAVPMGAFADARFPPPRFSVFEEHLHPWLVIVGEGIEHD